MKKLVQISTAVSTVVMQDTLGRTNTAVVNRTVAIDEDGCGWELRVTPTEAPHWERLPEPVDIPKQDGLRLVQ